MRMGCGKDFLGRIGLGDRLAVGYDPCTFKGLRKLIACKVNGKNVRALAGK